MNKSSIVHAVMLPVFVGATYLTIFASLSGSHEVGCLASQTRTVEEAETTGGRVSRYVT